MASNYWRSTQFKTWTPLARQSLNESIEDHNQPPKRTSRFTEKEKQMLIIHHIEMIHKWGKSEKLRLEQRVISTAIVYMWRFYLKNDIADCDPLLLGPTALLLASKIEECLRTLRISLVFYRVTIHTACIR